MNLNRVSILVKRTFGILVLLLLACIVAFPVYYSFMGSLMKNADIVSSPPRIWPEHGLTWSNIVTAVHLIPLGRQYLNSFGSTLVITFSQILTSLLAGYALAIMRVRGAKIWFALFLGTMMIPGEAIIIPNYLTIASLGLRNSFIALVLPYLASGFGIFMMYTFLRQFPMELVEAARLDGCSHLRILWSIVLPLSRPAAASLAIYTFLTHWNGFLWPLLVAETPQMQTIQIGITQLQSPDDFNPGLTMAGAVMAVVPTVIIVALCQRQIVRGLTAGSSR
ncbi:carbohydrate ABC transporter permease [Bifidobacterium aquikefiri]|uniref:carbohydrate ABC transporter permease n=1 Tax=Bifidobacterium aquikefiri TaxID=1653207 RepID=UPI0039EAEC0B